MYKTAIASFVLALFVVPQEPPQMPAPSKEHAWLQQFVGEWEYSAELLMGEGMPAMQSKGTETVRAIGGFWIIGENKGDMMGMPFTGVTTLGYDPEAKSYIGTWIDSMGSYLWRYTGSVDSTGKILTLESEGPSPMEAGKLAKFRDATEFKSKDHKVFTSSVQGADGTWVKMLTMDATRKE